jgi:predicted acyl esterase
MSIKPRRYLRWLLAASLACGAPPTRAQSAPQPQSTGLAQYQGQYRSLSDPDQITAVYLDGDSLYEESELRERQRLFPAAASDAAAQDRFRIETPKALLSFQRDASGATVNGLKITLDDRTILEAARISTEVRRLNHAREYTKQEAMVPMRDGVRLHAVILRPAQTDEGEMLPILMVRTPYGVDDYDSRRHQPQQA